MENQHKEEYYPSEGRIDIIEYQDSRRTEPSNTENSKLIAAVN